MASSPEPTEAMVEKVSRAIDSAAMGALDGYRDDHGLEGLARAAIAAYEAVSPGCRGAELAEATWRTGRKVGRTIYAQLGGSPSDSDPLIGTMDTRELASAAVEVHNAALAAFRASGEAGPDYKKLLAEFGGHKRSCMAIQDYFPKRPCTCGWDAALSGGVVG